jgi:cell division transport system permease protein
MMWIQSKRVFKAAITGFWRNGVVSLSAVLMVSLTLFVIGSVILSTALLQSSLDEVKRKVDVNVYFSPIALEEEVTVVRDQLAALPEVAEVEYVSREQALEEFKVQHAENPDVMRALEELGENPLGAALNVKAKEPQQYAAVAEYLATNYPEGGSIIEEVNYNENKTAIERLVEMIAAGKALGGAIAIIYILISIVIVFNTIRLTIYISRDEISVMRLVGASPNYVRGPFVVVGAVYGAVAAVITLLTLLPLTYWLGPFTYRFFASTSVFDYYISNMLSIGGILLLAGILTGAISSALATRKYLK